MTPQENFAQWADEHYELVGDPPEYKCRRCGAVVAYLTKHAAVRHGDDIEVMPAKNRNAELAESY